MKNFTNCIKDKNKDTWCFDTDVGMVCKIEVEYQNPSKIPQEVLFALLKAQSEKNEGAV